MNYGEPADVGVIGLAVMGRNLALNMADHGFRVAVYNRTPAASTGNPSHPHFNTALSCSVSAPTCRFPPQEAPITSP